MEEREEMGGKRKREREGMKEREVGEGRKGLGRGWEGGEGGRYSDMERE